MQTQVYLYASHHGFIPSNGNVNASMLTFTLVVVVTRSLPKDGGMAEDHGASEAGQLARAWTRGRKETESHQRASGAKSP